MGASGLSPSEVLSTYLASFLDKIMDEVTEDKLIREWSHTERNSICVSGPKIRIRD